MVIDCCHVAQVNWYCWTSKTNKTRDQEQTADQNVLPKVDYTAAKGFASMLKDFEQRGQQVAVSFIFSKYVVFSAFVTFTSPLFLPGLLAELLPQCGHDHQGDRRPTLCSNFWAPPGPCVCDCAVCLYFMCLCVSCFCDCDRDPSWSTLPVVVCVNIDMLSCSSWSLPDCNDCSGERRWVGRRGQDASWKCGKSVKLVIKFETLKVWVKKSFGENEIKNNIADGGSTAL